MLSPSSVSPPLFAAVTLFVGDVNAADGHRRRRRRGRKENCLQTNFLLSSSPLFSSSSLSFLLAALRRMGLLLRSSAQSTALLPPFIVAVNCFSLSAEVRHCASPIAPEGEGTGLDLNDVARFHVHRSPVPDLVTPHVQNSVSL